MTHRVKFLHMLLWLAGTALLFYIAACIALFAGQRRLMYFPQPNNFDTPSSTQNLFSEAPQYLAALRAAL